MIYEVTFHRHKKHRDRLANPINSCTCSPDTLSTRMNHTATVYLVNGESTVNARLEKALVSWHLNGVRIVLSEVGVVVGYYRCAWAQSALLV